MQKIIFKWWGMVGYYNFVADFNEERVTFNITSLNTGSNKKGELNAEEVKTFIKLFKESNVKEWSGDYILDEQLIMDGGSWNLCYVDENNDVYFTFCENFGCEPEGLNISPNLNHYVNHINQCVSLN